MEKPFQSPGRPPDERRSAHDGSRGHAEGSFPSRKPHARLRWSRQAAVLLMLMRCYPLGSRALSGLSVCYRSSSRFTNYSIHQLCIPYGKPPNSPDPPFYHRESRSRSVVRVSISWSRWFYGKETKGRHFTTADAVPPGMVIPSSGPTSATTAFGMVDALGDSLYNAWLCFLVFGPFCCFSCFYWP